ncbi:hypothetical protein EJ07DRAFT_153251 [Lizonia empirigonia]|nr:hypothetical protein EJ07DRAFT_153251 [Lizonia empirigonia]
MAKPTLINLPTELLVLIFSELDNSALLTARSVCRRFYGPASTCFRTITSYVPNDGHFRHMKLSPQMPLAQYVRNVCIVQPAGHLDNFDPLSCVVYQFQEALDHANRFPGLRGIYTTGALLRSAPFQVLQMLFERFGYGRRTLRELALDAIPPLHSPLTRTAAFRESMSAVQDLALSFDSWYNRAVWFDETSAPPDPPCCPTAHVFTESINEWIGQSQAVVKRLSLIFDNYVGYYPRLDLRDLHYPRLRVLDLSCVTLSHRYHVSWIVAHKATLTTLYLSDCPILVKAETNQVLDAEDFPVVGKIASEPVTFAPANLFWWSMLDTFRVQLTALRDFRVEFTCMDPDIQGVQVRRDYDDRDVEVGGRGLV